MKPIDQPDLCNHQSFKARNLGVFGISAESYYRDETDKDELIPFGFR